jgi:hypothetical protein
MTTVHISSTLVSMHTKNGSSLERLKVTLERCYEAIQTLYSEKQSGVVPSIATNVSEPLV